MSRARISLAAILLIGTIFYSWTLLKGWLIPGVDGPYYLIQVENLLKEGRLKYGDPPFVFYVSAALTSLLKDPTLAICLVVAIFSALSAVPAYLIVRRATRSTMGGYAASLACVFCPQLVRMAGDLMKNAVGIFFLLSFVYFLHIEVFSPSELSLVFSVLSFYLTFLTHALDFGFALLILLVYPFLALIIRREREVAVRWVAILVPCLLLVLVSYLLLPNLFSDLGKGVKFLRDLLHLSPSGRFPPSEMPKPPPRGPFLELIFDPYEAGFVVPALIAGCILAYKELRERSEAFPLLASAAILGLLCTVVSGMPDWGWRFRLMTMVPISAVIGVLASKVGSKVVSLSVTILLVGILSIGAARVALETHPLISLEEYEELERASKVIPPRSVVIIRSHINPYWVEYLLGTDRARGAVPELWGIYDHVLMLVEPKGWIPGGKVLFRGRTLILLEIEPPRG